MTDVTPCTDYVGFCPCGRIACLSCKTCATPLCDEHACSYPETPTGVSVYAQSQFARAVRLVGGVECEPCRAEKGRVALQQALNAPLEPLPDHWMDRAIALSGDQTRNEDQKRVDGELPRNVTVAEVIHEFLRRMGGRQPHERAKIVEAGLFRRPRFAAGWKIHCGRQEYTQQYPEGTSARHPLPLLVTPDAQVLGPPIGADEQNLSGAAWEPIGDADIDLPLMVWGFASILMLSRFTA